MTNGGFCLSAWQVDPGEWNPSGRHCGTLLCLRGTYSPSRRKDKTAEENGSLWLYLKRMEKEEERKKGKEKGREKGESRVREI